MPHTGSSGTRARHVDGAAGQHAQGGRREVGRGDEGLALAHEHAQAEIAALAALELFALAHALGDRDRLAVDVERVGRIGAGGLRPFQQVGEQVGVRRARSRLARRALVLAGAVFFALAMTALLRAKEPCRRDQLGPHRA